MKLIKGKTLALILSQEKPDLFSLTELFANIVKTMAYVHSKGVIHRDLKPSNIMVGAFGEIQIMDWGLAKTLSSEPTSNTALTSNVPDSVSIVETERTPDSMTQAGSILGTPAYMPPEQAKGDIDHTDTRSDVFALGAILCEMLTGKPAYVADTFDEIRAQSIIGHTQPALERLAKCGADEELIDLASRCLSPNPANRPTDAAAVAKSINAYRTNVSERLRRAEQERASAEIRIAEQSKRRKLLLSVGCLLGLASIAFLIYQNLQNRQLEKQTIVAKEAQAEALKAKSESDHLAQMAQRRLEKAVQAVETVITRVAGEKWALKPELQEERKEALVDAVAFFNGLGSEDSQDPIVQRQAARANLFASSAMISLAEYDQSEVAARTAAKLYRSIQADSPHDSSALRGEADAITLLGHINAIRAQFADALRNYQSALETAERAVKLEPDRNENQLAIANCCSALALFYSFQMPDRARENHLRALAIGEK
ncbi:MAG: serine/threonine-protein kinase, partial [Gemmataceae bacterium]